LIETSTTMYINTMGSICLLSVVKYRI